MENAIREIQIQIALLCDFRTGYMSLQVGLTFFTDKKEKKKRYDEES